MAIGGRDTTWKHATHGSPSSNNDYTSKVMSVTASFDGETADGTTFGDGFRDKEQTFKSHAYTVRYKHDTAMWVVVTDLWKNGTAITMELGPTGTAATNPKITGSIYCLSFTMPFAVGEIIAFDVNFDGTGAPDFDVFT